MTWILDPADPAVAAWQRGAAAPKPVAMRSHDRAERNLRQAHLSRARRNLRLGRPLTDMQRAALDWAEAESERRKRAREALTHSGLGMSAAQARETLRASSAARRAARCPPRAATMDGSQDRAPSGTKTSTDDRRA